MQAGAPKQRRCVLIVHGVGEQQKSSTLLSIGSPLVSWVERWARLFYGRTAADLDRVELSFVPFDVGQGDRPAYVILDLPDEQWFFAEAWWAGSNFHPDLGTMLYWSFVHLFDIIAQMVRATGERLEYLIHPKPPEISSQPTWIWQLVDLVNCVGLGVGYALACLIGYVLLVPLMLLAQIPIDAVQNWVLFKLLKPMLIAGAGEFRMYLDDEVQAANIRRRVGDTARWLLALAESDQLIIVAHSEGCVVSLGMLTDRSYADVARATRKLLTFGAGLNKSWLVRPRLDRLFAPLEGDILWTDFWASYDPVPAGPLDPSRRRFPGGRKWQITDVYKPQGDALEQVGPGQPPINEQLTNGMNVLTDHGGYFRNDEQVLLRLAAEIGSQWHTRSGFWPAANVLFDGMRKRRTRVSVLALGRDIAVAIWLFAAFGPWVLGWLAGVNPWASLSAAASAAASGVLTVPSTGGPAASLAAGIAAWLISVLTFLRGSLPDVLGVISGLAGMLLQLPALVSLALLIGAIVYAIYRLIQWQVWERWDRVARHAFLRACVQSSLERLRRPDKNAGVGQTVVAPRG